MEKIREELRQVSMHYDSKCEDYKLLEDRLQRTKGEYQTHITQLQKRYKNCISSFHQAVTIFIQIYVMNKAIVTEFFLFRAITTI